MLCTSELGIDYRKKLLAREEAKTELQAQTFRMEKAQSIARGPRAIFDSSQVLREQEELRKMAVELLDAKNEECKLAALSLDDFIQRHTDLPVNGLTTETPVFYYGPTTELERQRKSNKCRPRQLFDATMFKEHVVEWPMML